MDIYLGHLINWELQKSSSLIGQLATVHNWDWLTEDKQINKLSSIIFMNTTVMNRYFYNPDPDPIFETALYVTMHHGHSQ